MGISILHATPADTSDILALQKLAYQSEARLNNDWSIPSLTQTLPEIEGELGSRPF